MRVLFVDDDDSVCEFLSTFCRTLGIEHLVAHTAEEAYALCEKGAVELIVTDLAMPRIDGLDLARQIHKRFPEMGLFAFTGHSDAYSLKELDELFDRVYMKPMEYSRLIGETMKFLALRKYPFLA